jgi:RNA ligase-like protein
MQQIHKYPRTNHLAGSRLGPGDEDLEQIPLNILRGKPVVIEEKLDGANCAISFREDGELQLQSRGHYLTGGARERQFELFKAWAHRYTAEFWEAFGDRYIVYGEWTYGKHTVFYDKLPHYFHEFDVLDTATMEFLDTPSRHRLLAPLPIVSVPVLHSGDGECLKDPQSWVKRSLYKSESWRETLKASALQNGHDPEQVVRETDPSELSEGLYIKLEENGVVTGRYKWVRYDFLQTVADSGSHWQDRPLLPNLLADDVDLFRP